METWYRVSEHGPIAEPVQVEKETKNCLWLTAMHSGRRRVDKESHYDQFFRTEYEALMATMNFCSKKLEYHQKCVDDLINKMGKVAERMGKYEK